jgi:hypothetical protein
MIRPGDHSRRAVRDLHVGDAVRQHDRKENQDENAADVDQKLHGGDEVRAQKDVNPGDPGERAEQRKSGVDDVVRKRHHRRRCDDEERD